MMGSLKALQEWCRIQCEDYDVEIKNMSTSFRDGMAFCAIIHRHRPDLIDFDSLSKENVYENNRLAFEVAEAELGIPALLDPEDMVSMRVPDRLSIITYVSQYYNFFTNKSQANPPCMKRPLGGGHGEPAQKRPATPLEDKVVESENRPDSAYAGVESGGVAKCGTLSSTCAVCQKHVHLVQRFLVDGKLFHRNCFRCRECSSTLLPGAYKLGNDTGTLVCTHHFNRPALANQNGRPDLSMRPADIPSVKVSQPSPPETSPTAPDQNLPPAEPAVESSTPVTAPDTSSTTDSLEKDSERDSSLERAEKQAPAVPPNPFEESDGEGEVEVESEEEEEKQQEEVQKPTKDLANGSLPPTPAGQVGGVGRPVPAPRRVSEVTPPPRPAPRIRPPRGMDSPAVNGEHLKPIPAPKPRDRSHSPGSVSNVSGDMPKPKDPPWLALVQSESKKKPAPPPPPAGLATPPNPGSLSSLKGEVSRTKPSEPAPSNPFEDDDQEGLEEEEEEGVVAMGEGEVPSAVAANHPWYNIRAATKVDTPPSGGSSSRSASPGDASGKKRRAPPAPRKNSGQAPPHSQPSSRSPSPALSMESLSSGSDRSSSQPAGGDAVQRDLDHLVTKSVSEPSISRPGDPAQTPPCSSSSAERLAHPSPDPSPPPTPLNTSSAPATPQTNRSSSRRSRPPPPRPPATPSPLAAGTSGASANNKRICKENPFNRRASPSPVASTARPPRGPRPARPPAPGHGFPLIKRKVQSDQYIPVEDIHVEMTQLEQKLDEMEQRGVELEKKLRDNPNDEEEELLLVDWFTLIHEKHLLVRREAELVYTAKQQNLEERQADVEYELRCLLNKPEKEWTEEDKSREQELMAELVTVIEQRNQIITTIDQDRQREEEEDKFVAAMLKKKDFQKDPEGEQLKKKGGRFKPMKVLKRLSHKGEPGKGGSPRKEKS